ncbi:MAG: hypothetical protein JXR76_04020 [Deltaproteobacteria bacterium]|nr:hypothetical protein [Deltaproteobacteria bacterium]
MNSSKHWRATGVALALGLLILVFSQGGHSTTKTVTVLGGGEVWLYPENGGHGIVLAALDVGELPRSAKLSLSFNTDTLRIRYDNLSFADGVFQLGFMGTGEAVFSGLLPDYYRLGKLDETRGFNAHYVMLGGYFKLNLPKRQSLTLEYGARKWFFSEGKKTADAFVLPEQAWVFEPRLRYTFWRLGGGKGGRQRLFRRASGIAFGVEGGVDLRNTHQRWGAFDAGAFETPDTRNNPKKLALMGYQWLQWGWQFHSRVRVQFKEAAALGSGMDDLNRYRIGGMTPYVIPISGAQWAAFLSENLVSAQTSIHFLIFGETEIGMVADGVYFDDEWRTGRSSAGFQMGVGAFYDMAFGPNQLDVRAGWSPTMDWQSDAGQFSVFVSYGRNWSFGQSEIP